MRMTVDSTSKMITVNGIPARIWEGTTEKGSRVVAFVMRVTAMGEDDGEFVRDLLEVVAESPDVGVFPDRVTL